MLRKACLISALVTAVPFYHSSAKKFSAEAARSFAKPIPPNIHAFVMLIRLRTDLYVRRESMLSNEPI